jgi:flagellar biosynthesis/type III secretory pathway protein FliH
MQEEAREKGLAEGRAEGLAEGRAEGRAEGENRFGKLISLLLGQGRMDDVQKASVDPEFRNLLYREFQIA